MTTKKLIFAVLTAVFVLSIKGYTKPPKVSGNIEQGSRYAIPYDDVGFPTPWVEATEGDAEESWAYNFHKGYLKLYHRLNDRIRYTVKYNYIKKDFFAAETNNKNILRYYRTYSWFKLSNAFDLKLEYYLREQNYYIQPWNNLVHVPHMLLKWEINDKRDASFSVRYKAQRYDDPEETWKDKNQVSSYVKYKEDILDNLSLNAGYRYTYRHYTNNPDESNAIKKSLSAGFDYQF
jgi:hypothetical protein